MRKTLADPDMQAMMVSLRRLEDVYRRVRAEFRRPLLTDARGRDSASQVADLRSQEQADRDVKRMLRLSLLSSAYSITEQVLQLIVGTNWSSAKEMSSQGKPAKLLAIECAFQDLVGDAFDASWLGRWRELDQFRRLRNLAMHDAGVDLGNDKGKGKEVLEDVRAGRLTGVTLKPMFSNVEGSAEVIVVDETCFTNWLQKLQCFVLDVDAALVEADKKAADEA